MAILPSKPAVAESGIAGYDYTAWMGFAAADILQVSHPLAAR